MLIVPVYGNWIECKSLSELKAFQTDYNSFKMECLEIRKRMLGPGHSDMTEATICER